MGFKHTDPCLAKAADDEPIFVLRSTDKLAPLFVEMWANIVETYGGPSAKTAEARTLADMMRAWQGTHGSKWPD